jgi:peroxiredoxin
VSLSIGDPIPLFALPDTSDHVHRVDGGAHGKAASVVVFTCNHCPYALAWHKRLMQVARDYEPRDVRFYAICSNDGERYPRDSFAAMKQRVQADGGWPVPYLRDEDQDAARAFGAKTTPDVFVFDAEDRLVYRGAPDASSDDASENAQWLRDALDDLLGGGPVARAETKPVGCSIKWKA